MFREGDFPQRIFIWWKQNSILMHTSYLFLLLHRSSDMTNSSMYRKFIRIAFIYMIFFLSRKTPMKVPQNESHKFDDYMIHYPWCIHEIHWWYGAMPVCTRGLFGLVSFVHTSEVARYGNYLEAGGGAITLFVPGGNAKLSIIARKLFETSIRRPLPRACADTPYNNMFCINSIRRTDTKVFAKKIAVHFFRIWKKQSRDHSHLNFKSHKLVGIVVHAWPIGNKK